MRDALLTIFTPTYNRVGTLTRLRNSLAAQTEGSFEWLVVDDGSTDGTADLVRGWAQASPFLVRYIRQENSGKHVAHNLGAREAWGQLFMCVDSDDWLEPNAVATVHRDAAALGTEEGLLYPKLFARQITLGTAWFPEETTAVELVDMRMKYGLVIETAIVFNAEVLRRHPFPVVEGERYMPEGSVYYDFRAPELFRVHETCFYRCEYLDEGLTRNIWKNWYRNPVGTKLALRKRYEAARRYRGARGLRERASAIVGIESLNMARDLPVVDGVPGNALGRILLLPMSCSYARKRYREYGARDL